MRLVSGPLARWAARAWPSSWRSTERKRLRAARRPKRKGPEALEEAGVLGQAEEFQVKGQVACR
jgi:hypothetical protein